LFFGHHMPLGHDHSFNIFESDSSPAYLPRSAGTLSVSTFTAKSDLIVLARV
jgi:hypothetical protein